MRTPLRAIALLLHGPGRESHDPRALTSTPAPSLPSAPEVPLSDHPQSGRAFLFFLLAKVRGSSLIHLFLKNLVSGCQSLAGPWGAWAWVLGEMERLWNVLRSRRRCWAGQWPWRVVPDRAGGPDGLL